MKKHQLFKVGSYIQLEIGEGQVAIGKVKDSTIKLKKIIYDKIFNVPQETIELEPMLMTAHIDGYDLKLVYKNGNLLKLSKYGNSTLLFEGKALYQPLENRLRACVVDLQLVTNEDLKKEYYKRRSLINK